MPTIVHGDFEWDSEKAILNERKHGVSFYEALTAFDDERQLTIRDPQGRIDRFVLIGMSDRNRILFMVHAEIVEGARTRLISAWVANRKFSMQYTGETS